MDGKQYSKTKIMTSYIFVSVSDLIRFLLFER